MVFFSISLWIHTMNRCTQASAPRTAAWRIILATALLCMGLVAHAQDSVRPFPANALRGTLQVTQPPELLLNGQTARLSPGARIRGVNNMLVMSGALVGQSLVVNYVRDAQGMVHEVWLLNPTEARQKMPGMPAQGNYGSESYVPATPDGTGTATTSPQQ
jgi:hypothetical protein